MRYRSISTKVFHRLNQPQFLKPLCLVLLIALLLIGGWFRVGNLSQKVFWVDEVATVIRAAGYTKSEITQQLADGQPRSPADLLHYQQLTPERPLTDTIRALARSPEHAPLYFLLCRFWMQLFGSSVMAIRSLSVLASLLVLPCVYWFCRVLFSSFRIAVVAVLLMAVSPFFIAYAQEARPYSLWLLTVVGCSGALLQAMHRQTKGSWAVYALALTVSLYTSLLSILLVVGQGWFVITARQPASLRRFLIAVGMATVAFLPWVWVIGQHWEALGSNTTWMRTTLNPLVMLAIWLYSFAVLFFDVPVVAQGWVAVAQAIIAASVLAIMGYALYSLRKLPQARFLLTALCLPIPITLILLDLLFQGQASATTRYLMPSQFGLLIATAGCLAMPLTHPTTQFKPIRPFLLTFLIGLSLLSCGVNLNRSPDYQKDRNRANPAIAAIVNQATQPILLAEPTQTLDLLSLSHNLKPSTQIQILPAEQVALAATTSQHCEHFLFNPSDALLASLQPLPDLTIQERYQPDLLTPTDFHLSLWTLRSTQCDPL